MLAKRNENNKSDNDVDIKSVLLLVMNVTLENL